MNIEIHPSTQAQNGLSIDSEVARSQIEAWAKDGNLEQVKEWALYCAERWYFDRLAIKPPNTQNIQTPGELYSVLSEAAKSFDGQVWAGYFLNTIRQLPPPVVNEEFMTAWFSNAIMAGYNAGSQATYSALEEGDRPEVNP